MARVPVAVGPVVPPVPVSAAAVVPEPAPSTTTTAAPPSAPVVLVAAPAPLDPLAGLPEVEESLWYAATPTSAARRERAPVVALTFDDGPDPRWTPAVLQILAEERVSATFCVVGASARRHRELARAVVAQGHALCNHSEHHGLGAEEVAAGAATLAEITGHRPLLYRAPGGRLSPELVAAARSQGMRVLGWSVDSRDFERPPAPELVARGLAAGPGAVVLFHDGGGDRSQTVAALRPLIQGLRAKGYAFATPLTGPSE